MSQENREMIVYACFVNSKPHRLHGPINELIEAWMQDGDLTALQWAMLATYLKDAKERA